MVAGSLVPRLTDIVEAIERIHGVLDNISLQEFETDWQRQWIVERGIEIISEASRRLTDDMKARHPEIPWQKVAAIGNVLRHEYDDIIKDRLWQIVQNDIPSLVEAARAALCA